MPTVMAPDGLARARADARRMCAEHHVPLDRCHDLQVVLSELVGNACRHGGPPVTYDLAADGHELLGTVADADPTPPPNAASLPDAADAAESGRGLHIVAALSRRWGWRPAGTGEAVWARV